MLRCSPNAAARSNSSAGLTSKKWKCDPTCIGRSPELRTLSVVTGRSASKVIDAEAAHVTAHRHVRCRRVDIGGNRGSHFWSGHVNLPSGSSH